MKRIIVSPLNLVQQQGAVLIVALFVVVLTATLSYFMLSQLEKDTWRTSLVLRNIQANFYAQGSVAWAKEQLLQDLALAKPGKRTDELPLQSAINEVNGYRISSTIYDAQARMNINDLHDAVSQANFKHLVQLVVPGLPGPGSQEILQAVLDWISPGERQTRYTQYYLSLSPPYRAGHRDMVSISELQLVKGVSPQLYAALQPYLIALPSPSPINIQTAAPAVMAALASNMTLDTGKAIEKWRSTSQFASVSDFLNLKIVQNHEVSSDKITTLSNYFLVETRVKIEKQQVVLYTLLKRDNTEGKAAIHILWQSKTVPG